VAEYIAHVRKSDNQQQSVAEHLQAVAEISKTLALKLNVPEAGELIGLLHDFGKYSADFQAYIKSGTGLLNPDSEDFVDAKSKKGKIDHSTAGAQWIWQKLSNYGKNGEGKLCAQILALCIASHHSGLIDCLKPDGTNVFKQRVEKPDEKSHLDECTQNADGLILEQAEKLADKHLLLGMLNQIKRVLHSESHQGSKITPQFYLGFWTRFLFSCLIDADRINSADFESPDNITLRNKGEVPWNIAIERTEAFLYKFAEKIDSDKTPIDAIRQTISDTCKQRASDPQGIYTLTVPTGGGKTYASLRYALHHAKTHGLERIIYVIPFTSIIEQNAAAIRKVIEQEGDAYPWVLEHHCNLEPEQQTWHSKLATDNWDSPIILTTMVQFLETLFSGGTRGVRRLHQLANSVIISDEIQTLPIHCTHLFCNALNFLSEFTHTTAVLCTATQPLLDKLKSPDKGQLRLAQQPELMGASNEVRQLFTNLKRVHICNKTKTGGWTEAEIAALAIAELNFKGSCLVVVNTKKWAKNLFLNCATTINPSSLFHLSTNQCSTHRSEILNRIRQRLNDNLPVLCISTQLIEAGVDVDFASVIRFLAGMDSIAQAAGRCNRNGRSGTATVTVVNPDDEKIDQLLDIKIGQEKTERVLSETQGEDLLAPEVMQRYFNYYFYERADAMTYLVTAKQAGIDDTLLNLLSHNPLNIYKNEVVQLRQSFMTAGDVFKAIDAPTNSVIVQHGHGECLVEELCALSKKFNAAKYSECLKQAQKYSVNVFPNTWKILLENEAIHEIHAGEGVYYLDKRYYSSAFGLSVEPVNRFESIIL